MDDNQTERRRDYRLMQEVSIFLETYSSSPDDNPIGKISLCCSLDISLTGLRMKLDDELPLHAILQMGIQFSDKRHFHLVGEVRWLKKLDDGVEVGFEILESEQTDYFAWRALFDASATTA